MEERRKFTLMQVFREDNYKKGEMPLYSLLSVITHGGGGGYIAILWGERWLCTIQQRHYNTFFSKEQQKLFIVFSYYFVWIVRFKKVIILE